MILIVPGAFGTPAGFDKLLPYLEEAGFLTSPGPYPSYDPSDPATATCQNDITSLRNNYLLPLLEQKKDVVILGHSYGGVVAGGAAKDLDKPTRQAQGLTSDVLGLIYVAGNITMEGESLASAVGGKHAPFIKVDKVLHTDFNILFKVLTCCSQPSKGLAVLEPAMDVLYNDCNPALAPKLERSMRPHALLAFDTKATAPAWADKGFDGKRAYVRTLDDCCNPSWLQDAWLKKSGVQWEVVDFKTGHMPFVSQPEALGTQIVKFIHGFMG